MDELTETQTFFLSWWRKDDLLSRALNETSLDLQRMRTATDIHCRLTRATVATSLVERKLRTWCASSGVTNASGVCVPCGRGAGKKGGSAEVSGAAPSSSL